MSVANIMLNEVPNNNDATHVGSNVCLTTMGTQQFSMVASYIIASQHAEKLTYQRRQDNKKGSCGKK